MKFEKYINKKIYITDKNSVYYKDWGVIKFIDGEFFHVGIANDKKALIILNREQFKFKKGK